MNIITEEFGIYLQYVRKLGFEETPDYDFLRGLFDKAIEKSGEQDDGIYDWMLLNNGKGWQTLSKRTSRHHTTNKKIVDNSRLRQPPQPATPQPPLQEHQELQLQSHSKKSGGFWSKLTCGLCQ
jgi:casein kinase 1